MRKLTHPLVLVLIIVVFSDCRKEGPVGDGGNDQPQLIPALFASVDGNWTGIWVFDTDSLKLIDSFDTGPIGVPFSIEFSPDYQIWYSIWESTILDYGLFAVDARTKAILRRMPTTGKKITSDKDKCLLIAHGNDDVGYIEFYRRDNLSLVHRDSLGGLSWFTVASPTERKLYVFHSTHTGQSIDNGILVYDFETHTIDRKIGFADSSRQRNLEGADIKISPDGQYVFVTAFDWGCWCGIFFAFDLNTDSVVAEYPCGSFSQMGVSPDGKYVYITDPAGYLYEMTPTEKVWRYDVQTRVAEVLIYRGQELGLVGGPFVTEEAVVSQDNRTLFLTIAGGLRTTEGMRVHIVKIDLTTKKVLDFYGIPPDDRGYITKHIRKLKLGKSLIERQISNWR